MHIVVRGASNVVAHHVVLEKKNPIISTNFQVSQRKKKHNKINNAYPAAASTVMIHEHE